VNSEKKMKLDLHAHFFTNWKQGRFSLERAPRTPRFIIDAARSKGIDGFALTNFGDSGEWKEAYEEFCFHARDMENLGGYKVAKRIKNAIVFELDGNFFYVIKAQEIPSREGHILSIGLDEGEKVPSGLSLEDSLKVAGGIGISNADHPFGLMGIGINNLKKYRNLIDVFEKNMNFESRLFYPILGRNPREEEMNWLQEEIGVNWIAVSDCHNRRDIGNGYIETFKCPDFSSSENLRGSMKDILKSREYNAVIKKANSILSLLGHILICQYDVQIKKTKGTTP